jgi:hypothetical protein
MVQEQHFYEEELSKSADERYLFFYLLFINKKQQ